MEELGFHRKYRPKTISEYIGNDGVKKEILSRLNNHTKPQVYRFTGVPGSGKTTMARLVTKEYLCENRSEETGACNVCHNCKAINEYIETGVETSLTNVREIDATDNAKAKDIVELLDDASRPSYDGNWKVYILDEAHAISQAAQNKLLKTLEEPPEKVLIILCTSEPSKMIKAITSRCQMQCEIEKPTRAELLGLLKRVCKTEQVTYNTPALSLICVKADFVPRESLMLLENVIGVAKNVLYEDTVKILNIVEDKYYFEFFRIMLDEHIDIQRYITFLGNIKLKLSFKVFINGIVPFLVRGIYSANSVVAEGLDQAEIDQYKKLFKEIPIQDLAKILSELLRIRSTGDVEINLMLLGYKGLHTDNIVTETTIKLNEHTAVEDKKSGEAEVIKLQAISKEEMDRRISKEKEPMDANDIATLFGGVKVDITAK